MELGAALLPLLPVNVVAFVDIDFAVFGLEFEASEIISLERGCWSEFTKQDVYLRPCKLLSRWSGGNLRLNMPNTALEIRRCRFRFTTTLATGPLALAVASASSINRQKFQFLVAFLAKSNGSTGDWRISLI